MGDEPTPMRELLFEVFEQSSGKKYKIYTDGWIEGFEKQAWVANWYQSLLAREIATYALDNRAEGST
jgi:hypothetical protein